MSNYKAIAIAASIALIGAFFPTPTAKAQYFQNSAQLLDYGNQYYNQNCVSGSKFYFAYIQRNPNLSYADTGQIRQRIRDCEQGHPTPPPTHAGNDGKYDDPSQPAPSDPKQKRCGAYAVLAVTAQRINQRAGCGFGGNRWSLDYDNHYNWCMDSNVSAQDLRSESSIRSNALNGCVFK